MGPRARRQAIRTDTPATIAGQPTSARIDAFVARNFSLRGTLALHRGALGWDLLRAPVNLILAPVLVLTRLAALLARIVRLRRVAAWLGGRRILLPTRVASRVEALLQDELLAPGAGANPAVARLVTDYADVRSAVAEITTSLVVLAAGASLFHAATPGVVSLAPRVSDYVTRAQAVASFPLGDRLGGVWYAAFPTEVPVWSVVAMCVALAMAASVVTTFAGVLADPLQAATGLHQRRLRRLLARVEAADPTAPGIASEHVVARLADVGDLVLGLVRTFRP